MRTLNGRILRGFYCTFNVKLAISFETKRKNEGCEPFLSVQPRHHDLGAEKPVHSSGLFPVFAGLILSFPRLPERLYDEQLRAKQDYWFFT